MTVLERQRKELMDNINEGARDVDAMLARGHHPYQIVPVGGVRPLGRTDSGCCFDRLPGVVVLELGGAQIAKG
jgi:hypothetical protein